MKLTDEQILEGNKNIAEFRGFKLERMSTGTGYVNVYQTNHFKRGLGNTCTSGKYNEDKLKFHSSWDWLMPVVIKINNLDHIEGIDKEWNKFNQVFINFTIEDLYNAVVEFIEWYNNQKK